MASYQNFTFTAYVNLAQGAGYGLLSYGQLRPSHLLDAYDGSNNGSTAIGDETELRFGSYGNYIIVPRGDVYLRAITPNGVVFSYSPTDTNGILVATTSYSDGTDISSSMNTTTAYTSASSLAR